MEHILDLDKQSDGLQSIFRKIKESNTILFLGAGASVGEKRYLSREVIEYYEAKIHKKINEPNITKFVDILSSNTDFNRVDFDKFVVDMLHKYEVTEGHRIMATLPWREIITTNYDLVVEKAYDEINKTAQKLYDLKPIKSLKQLNYRESNSEIKYIKLNGCISDFGQHPLIFSSDDFDKQKSFYKNVLNELKNLSPEISFLSIGYSFSDDFATKLLTKFDSYNYRDRKWMINVDPYPNESALSYYAQKRIGVIKCSFQEFFQRYKEWDQNNAEVLVKKKGLTLTNSKNQHISISAQLKLNLEGVVKQLNINTKDKFIKDSEFYLGEEPNFNLITRGADVVKTAFIDNFKSEIQDKIVQNGSTFIPIFFIQGDFGIGKSTFTLRLIYELEKTEGFDLVAYEIIDFTRLKKEHIIELIHKSKAKHFILYCDEVEIESYFRSLLDLQRDLSIEQIHDCNILFIVPIRENILRKHKQSKTVPHHFDFTIDGSFTDPEVEELLDKLKGSGLVSFRDTSERRTLVDRIKNDYDSDSFISLMSIVTNGRHENDLISCYNELSSDTQKAFLHTALIHRYKLLMPANWLKQSISQSWDEFTERVIKAEGKGILLQEFKSTHGTQPDLYFRTKHPLIAEKLVNIFIPRIDSQFETYEKMLKGVEVGQTNSYLVNDLLKAFIKSEVFNDSQVNKLFDAAFTKMSDDPYFLLNYAINLQTRRTKTDIKKAINLLLYAETLFDYRNHRFIHRRGVLNFELAKLFFDEQNQLNSVLFHLKEARELFVTKQLYDPFSSYSYYDYIKMLLWELDNLNLDDEDKMQRQILIEDLFDLANRTVTAEVERINQLFTSYFNYLKKISNNNDYKLHLDELYQDDKKRPYACILLYNYHEIRVKQKKEIVEKCIELIDEMENYQDNFEIVKFLFKYYGRNLHDTNIRIKFQRLSRQNPLLEKENPLRYNYFNFMAESYNYLFHEGKTYLLNLQSKYYNMNPEFHYVWKDANGYEIEIVGQVVKNTGEKYKAIKIPAWQQTFRLKKGNYESFGIGQPVLVKLHFYLYGIIAEIKRKA